MDATEVSVCSQEERRFGELVERLHCKNTVAFLSAVCVCIYTFSCVVSDYKNNLLKEKVFMSTQPKVIDLDKGNVQKMQTQLSQSSPFSSKLNLNLSSYRDAEIF